mgnify:CR=1 FL=1
MGRNIWVAFYDKGHWYVAPHDVMVEHATNYGYTKTSSWVEGGAYSVKGLSKQMRNDLEVYRFQSLAEVSDEAAQEST